MHSLIFQVSTNPIRKEEFINFDSINEGEMAYIDYESLKSDEGNRSRMAVAEIYP